MWTFLYSTVYAKKCEYNCVIPFPYSYDPPRLGRNFVRIENHVDLDGGVDLSSAAKIISDLVDIRDGLKYL